MRIAQQITAADAYDAHRASGKTSSGRGAKLLRLPVKGQGRLF